MPKGLMDAVKRSISDARAGGALETDLPTAEDFSFFIWREIFRAIIHNEKQALETSKTLELEVEVKQHDGHCSEKVRKSSRLRWFANRENVLGYLTPCVLHKNAMRTLTNASVQTNCRFQHEQRTWDGVQPKRAAAPSDFVYRDPSVVRIFDIGILIERWAYSEACCDE